MNIVSLHFTTGGLKTVLNDVNPKLTPCQYPHGESALTWALNTVNTWAGHDGVCCSKSCWWITVCSQDGLADEYLSDVLKAWFTWALGYLTIPPNMKHGGWCGGYGKRALAKGILLILDSTILNEMHDKRTMRPTQEAVSKHLLAHTSRLVANRLRYELKPIIYPQVGINANQQWWCFAVKSMSRLHLVRQWWLIIEQTITHNKLPKGPWAPDERAFLVIARLSHHSHRRLHGQKKKNSSMEDHISHHYQTE